jgi:hypothetical protein
MFVLCFRFENGVFICRRGNEIDRAILDLKVLQRNLDNRAVALEGRIEKGKDVYRQLTTAPSVKRDRADLVLRQVATQEKLLERYHNYSCQVESMLLDISEQQTLKEVIKTLNDGKDVMKSMLLPMEDVECMLQDSATARIKQESIEKCLQKARDVDVDVSENDLQSIREEVGEIPPSVPKNVPISEDEISFFTLAV